MLSSQSNHSRGLHVAAHSAALPKMMMMMLLVTTFLCYLSHGLVVPSPPSQRQQRLHRHTMDKIPSSLSSYGINGNNDGILVVDDDETISRHSRESSSIITSRRNWLLSSMATGIATAAMTTTASPANAASDSLLYKPNPLTNGVLEQIRIWEQAEADNIKYGGELERGDAGSINQQQGEAYPRLLVPILGIARDLDGIESMLLDNKKGASSTTTTSPSSVSSSSLQQIQTILRQPVYSKIAFKKTFNAYGDNIYYSDPDRANVYLAGGATPKSEQSLAYLLRNEILNNVEDLQAEVDFLITHYSDDEATDDMMLYSHKANVAMKQYLEGVVPPGELERAKQLL